VPVWRTGWKRTYKEVFTAGFADPNLWSNHAWATDTGFNWYLNFYTKFALDWQHSEFGNPVVISPNHLGPTRDLIWLRFQVFF
jgi:phosphate-selective porin OprO and OprP